MVRSRLSLLLLVVAVTGCAARHPAMLAAPRLGSGVVVTGERVRIDCEGRGGDVDCHLGAGYSLRGSVTDTVPISVYSARASGLELCVDDRPVPLAERAADAPLARATAPTAADAPADGTVVAGAAERDASDPAVASWRRAPEEPLRTDVGWLLPGTPRTATLGAELRPEPLGRWRLVTPAPIARHPAMARWLGIDECELDSEGCRLHLDYLPAPSSGGAVSLSVNHPPGWKVTVLRASADRPGEDVADDDGRDRLVAVVDTGELLLLPGGPFVALGPRVAASGVSAHWRAGYELFAPQWAGYSLAIEGDAGGELMMVPAFEAVAPMMWFLPSVGFGAGLPVRLPPPQTVGARLQASAAYPHVGAHIAMDIFDPGQGWISGAFDLQLTL